MDETTARVTTNGNTHRSAEELRADIERTRGEITETLHAIETRLSPTTVKQTVTEGLQAAKDAIREQLHDAKDAVREELHEATVGKVEDMVHKAERKIDDVRGSVVDTIRDNPIPALMTGIGLAWLLMNRRSRSASPAMARPGGYLLQGQEEQGGQASAGIAQRAREGAGQIAEKLQGAAHEMSHRVQETAHAVTDSARETAERVAERAGQIAEQTRIQARRVENRVEQSFFDNPIAFAAGAIAVGAALGLALPRTRREDEWMGSARDQLLEKAQSSAQGTVEKVEQAAKTIVSEPARLMQSEPREESQSGGMTPSTESAR